MNATAQKHMTAIKSFVVTKSNVIGIRKAINHVERLRHGGSGNRSSVTPEEADTIEMALKEHEPIVSGELHESGLNILRSKRWAKRFNERQHGIISRLNHFTLVRFDRIGRNGEHAMPVYRAVATGNEHFLFRNVPWQTADALNIQSGPLVVGEFR